MRAWRSTAPRLAVYALVGAVLLLPAALESASAEPIAPASAASESSATTPSETASATEASGTALAAPADERALEEAPGATSNEPPSTAQGTTSESSPEPVASPAVEPASAVAALPSDRAQPPSPGGAETSGGAGSSQQGSSPAVPATNAAGTQAGVPSSSDAASEGSAAPTGSSDSTSSSPQTDGRANARVGSSTHRAGSGARGHQHSARGRKAAGGRFSGVAGAVGAGSAATLVPAARLTGGAPKGAGGHGVRASVRAHANSGGDPPVVKTVAHIVSVVPRSVWIMIAVLALISVALAAGSWLAAARARQLARQRARLAEDVGVLQAALLPTVPALIGPLHASAAYRPAEGPAAGGDFYDVFTTEDGRIAVILGDISGHGRAALPQTALIRYTARAYLDTGMAPRVALRAAAGALDHQLGHECFATAVLAIYDPAERLLTYACAGHPPPLVIAGDALQPVLAAASPPIGLGLETGRRQSAVVLPGGAQICFFTDGVVEARAGAQLFGSDRLTRVLHDLGPGASADDVIARVVAATDRRPDDMAACMLELEGTPRAASLRIEELELDRVELDRGRAERFLVACDVEPAACASILREARIVLDDAGSAVIHVRVGREGPQVAVSPARRTFVRPFHPLAEDASLGSTLLP